MRITCRIVKTIEKPRARPNIQGTRLEPMLETSRKARNPNSAPAARAVMKACVANHVLIIDDAKDRGFRRTDTIMYLHPNSLMGKEMSLYRETC